MSDVDLELERDISRSYERLLSNWTRDNWCAMAALLKRRSAAQIERMERAAGLLPRLPRRATYADKLKDPRWQRRRLEIMSRADFKCEECGSGTNTLHVHHRAYSGGREPWEYEDDELACLCEGCHEAQHNLVAVVR